MASEAGVAADGAGLCVVIARFGVVVEEDVFSGNSFDIQRKPANRLAMRSASTVWAESVSLSSLVLLNSEAMLNVSSLNSSIFSSRDFSSSCGRPRHI